MDETRKSGRVTIPTDLDVVPETLEILKKWGADAIRDCDGTDFPQQLKDADAKIYSTYYTTRKDNAWAKANPDEVQQCYIMTGFYTAPGDTVTIPLMKGISPELMQVNTNDDITRWWEVMDRTTGQPVPPEQWSYADGSVTVQAVPFHEYTVSFLAYLIWDPVHMYNATTNGWTNFEHQITFDVRQPKTHKYSMERLRKFIAEHPYVNVIRYTTFFHQFTLIFDELKREKFVDWYGYSASVSPYILNQFEQEVGYKFRPEYIIDQGYYNNQYRVPSREFRDFQAFQRREVAKLAKEMVDITHECGCEAMMFLGDQWIGTEPFMPEFKTIGLDAVVGSVGNGSTLRLISDIEGVKYTEGRFLPYFFPDTFHEGGDPVREAKEMMILTGRGGKFAALCALSLFLAAMGAVICIVIQNYFMLPVKVKNKNATEPGITMMTLVKGKANAKTVNDLTEVVSMPVCAADLPSGREAAMLPGLIDVIQGYVSQSLGTNFPGLKTYVRPLGKADCDRAVVSEDDIAECVSQDFRERMKKKGIDITSDAEADSLFLDGGKTLVSYVVTPGEFHPGAVCWKIVIDARTHELYYYKKQNLKSAEYAGFLKADLKKIAKTR